MRCTFYVLIISFFTIVSCSDNDPVNSEGIVGYDILEKLDGHWVGENQTAFGFYDWFAFDFRPISSSHVHSIYEGGTNQNIITSVFIADFEGKQQIMARNGGWLGNQYRATYFVLDKAEKNGDADYYRLSDAVGGVNRAYLEFRFVSDSIYIDAYKDNSGELEIPIHHMGFSGANRNPSYSQTAKEHFDYPQEISEVDLNNKFTNLIDPDSALFLEEGDDPFPKSAHGYLSDLTIGIDRNIETQNQELLLFISKESIVSSSGTLNMNSLDNSVVRTIDIESDENNYLTTYLHPDKYYITVFADLDDNGFPSSGDYSSVSIEKEISVETLESTQVQINILVP